MATTYIHHNHNSQTLDNDIALLKLHGEAELKVKQISLDNDIALLKLHGKAELKVKQISLLSGQQAIPFKHKGIPKTFECHREAMFL